MTSFTDDINSYLDHLRSEGLAAPNTISAYRSDLNKLSAFAAGKQIRTVEEMDHSFLEGYVESLKTSGIRRSSLQRTISCLHGFFRYLKKTGRIPENYSEVLDTVATPRGTAQPRSSSPLTDEEVTHLIQSAEQSGRKGPRDAAILSLMSCTGIRPEELVMLRVCDLDFLLNEIRIHTDDGNSRTVPMDQDSARRMRQYIRSERDDYHGREDFVFHRRRDGKPLTRQNIWKLVKKYGELAGLAAPATPRRLRLTAERVLTDKGADPSRIYEILGRRMVK